MKEGEVEAQDGWISIYGGGARVEVGQIIHAAATPDLSYHDYYC